MRPNYAKFQAMESILWEEKLVLPFIWDSYGDRMPIEIPHQVCLLHAFYGTDVKCRSKRQVSYNNIIIIHMR